MRNALRYALSPVVSRIPQHLKARTGRLFPYFPIPRDWLAPRVRTYGTLYQLVLYVLGSEDRLTSLDEPYTATMIDELHEDDVFVDIGANIGLYTLMAARRCKTVIAIEPGRPQFWHLKRNVRLNDLENVACINVACWDREVTLPLYHNVLSHGWDSLLRKYTKSYDVKAKELDTIVAQVGARSVDMMKVDVEGVELEVLRGAKRTLPRTTKIIVELHENVDPRAVRDVLTQSGFETESLYQHGSEFVVGNRK